MNEYFKGTASLLPNMVYLTTISEGK